MDLARPASAKQSSRNGPCVSASTQWPPRISPLPTALAQPSFAQWLTLPDSRVMPLQTSVCVTALAQWPLRNLHPYAKYNSLCAKALVQLHCATAFANPLFHKLLKFSLPSSSCAGAFLWPSSSRELVKLVRVRFRDTVREAVYYSLVDARAVQGLYTCCCNVVYRGTCPAQFLVPKYHAEGKEHN